MIKILLVDDHEIVLYGLKIMFEKHQDFDVCSTATSVSEAFDQVSTHKPDVVLMDMRLPDGDGISAGVKIKQNFPQIKVILLTAFDNNALKLEVSRAKLDGFILKNINSRELVKSVYAIATSTEIDDSHSQIHTPMGKLSIQHDLNLSERESQVLELIALGKTNQEIADELRCTEKTIRNHITSIFQKINVSSRAEAIIFWIRYKMVD